VLTRRCIQGNAILSHFEFLEMSSTIASLIEDWVRVNDRYLDRITLEDFNLLTLTGFTDSHFSNLLLNDAIVIEFDGILRISTLKLFDIEKFTKNLAQFLINISSRN
jgi:hypothetical protein